RAGRSARATTSTRIWRRSGSTSKSPAGGAARNEREAAMETGACACSVGIMAALLVAASPAAGEVAKRGGVLTYVIAADAPPSFDAHREGTFATVHSAAPFYSLLIRVNPDNPGSTSDFVCDLCTELPQPTNEGRTYSFKIRDGVKFHDGSPPTPADV